MDPAIGMIELNSIAKGIETCDFMLKATDVKLIFFQTVCPGKFIILVSGVLAEVKSSVYNGFEIAE